MHEGALTPGMFSREARSRVLRASFLDGLCAVVIPYFLLGWLFVVLGIIVIVSFAHLIARPAFV